MKATTTVIIINIIKIMVTITGSNVRVKCKLQHIYMTERQYFIWSYVGGVIL